MNEYANRHEEIRDINDTVHRLVSTEYSRTVAYCNRCIYIYNILSLEISIYNNDLAAKYILVFTVRLYL